MHPAEIEWNQEGQPYSPLFKDRYFSKCNGLEESRYVFLKHNNLAERFTRDNKPYFTIGETGFGSGLNFLATWQLFTKVAPKGMRLHYISIEKHPLTKETIKKASTLWPELEDRYKDFLAVYPSILLQGFHHLHLDNHRVTLTLLFDDALKAIPKINGTMDAWFFDGFAPANNPAMWSEELFEAVAQHATNQTTFATYTAAGCVKKALAQAGFQVERVKGYGQKRHMLCGYFNNNLVKPIQKERVWLDRPKESYADKKAIIIGAGLAGSSTAYALANRGWQVTVIDQDEKPASGASGNPQGVLYMRLSAGGGLLNSLLLHGFLYTLSLLKQKLQEKENITWSTTGLIQLGFNAQETKRQQGIIQHAFPDNFIKSYSLNELTTIAGVTLEKEGLYFHQGGWVNAEAFCKKLLDHPNIVFTGNQKVHSLTKNRANLWQVNGKEEKGFTAPVVVLANSCQAAHIEQTRWLPLTSIRGQLSFIPATEKSKQLKVVLCGKGYITPAMNDVHTVGATHQFNDYRLDIREQDHIENIARLKEDFPAFYDALKINNQTLKMLQGRAGIRCTTPDYLPAIGPISDEKLFTKQYSHLAKDARYRFSVAPIYNTGLYVNVGHGSRGLITGPISGEILASYLENEVFPIPNFVQEALHPNRFLARKLIYS